MSAFSDAVRRLAAEESRVRTALGYTKGAVACMERALDDRESGRRCNEYETAVGQLRFALEMLDDSKQTKGGKHQP